jgi:23S rRNA (uracil1939-C5)-methyltransferase
MAHSPPDRQSPPNPGDLITLRLDSLAAGGEAVGRHDGLAVFVEYGAPGDVAQVRVTHAASNFARGTIKTLVEPGPARVGAPCPYFPACGGCQWQHLDYAFQLRAKEQILRESLARIGGREPQSMGPALGMAHPFDAGESTPWRYRGAAEYSVAPPSDTTPPALGFLRARSSEVIPIADCLVQHPLNIEVLRAVNDWLAHRGTGELWLVRTRASFAEERALVTLVSRAPEPTAEALAGHLLRALPAVAGVSALVARSRRDQHHRLSHHIAGEQFIFDEIAGRRYRISADTFFQVNARQAAHLAALVQEMAQLRRDEVVLDAYCGTGVFLLALAEQAGQAVGIESNPAAVRDGRANLRRAGVTNAALVREKVERALPFMAQGRRRESGGVGAARAHVVVLDPPRQGCGRQVINAVAALGPRAVIMVSCDTATLARDVALLAEHGYALRRSVVVDMFPHSWRVESVTLCER